MNPFRNNKVAVGLIAGIAIGFVSAVLMAQGVSQPAKPEAPSAAARVAAAKRVCQMLHDQTTGAPGHLVVEHTYVWSMRWMEAQRDLDAARGDRVSALEAHLKRMRDFQARVAELNKQKLTSKFDLASADFYVAEAEEMLARAKVK